MQFTGFTKRISYFAAIFCAFQLLAQIVHAEEENLRSRLSIRLPITSPNQALRELDELMPTGTAVITFPNDPAASMMQFQLEPAQIYSAAAKITNQSINGPVEHPKHNDHFRSSDGLFAVSLISVPDADTASRDKVLTGAIAANGLVYTFEKRLKASQLSVQSDSVVLDHNVELVPLTDTATEKGIECGVSNHDNLFNSHQTDIQETAKQNSSSGAQTDGGGGYGPRTLLPRIAEIYLEADNDYVNVNGGLQPAIDRMASTINAVNVIYQQQLAIRLSIVGQTMWSTSADPYTTSSLEGRFAEFQTQLGALRNGLGDDLTQLFTGVSWSGIAGFAVSGSACGMNQLPASVIGNIGTADGRVMGTAHELGHVLSLGHNPGPGFIMSPFLSNASSFLQSDRDIIRSDSHYSFYSCLQEFENYSAPPLPPTSVRISLDSTGFTGRFLRWDYPAGGGAVTGFDVFLNSNCSGTPALANTRARSFADSSLVPGQVRTYSVRSVSQVGVSSCVEVAVPTFPTWTITDVDEPDTQASRRMFLHISPSEPVNESNSGVVVYASTNPTPCAGEARDIRTVAYATMVAFEEPLYGTPVYYSMRGYAPNALGTCSAVASQTISSPSSVTASAGTDATVVNLSWTNDPRARNLLVYRYEEGAPSTQVTLAGMNSVTSYTDVSANSDGRHYRYFIQGCNAAGCSDSTHVLGYRDALPGRINNLQASDGSAPRIGLNWEVAPFGRVQSVKVYRSLSGSETDFQLLTTLNGTASSYDDLSFEARSGYPVRYRVAAVSAFGEGQPSISDTGYAAVAAPSVTTGLSALEASNSSPANPVIRITFSTTVNAPPAYYRIHRSTAATAGCSGEVVWTGTRENGNLPIDVSVPQYSLPYYFAVQGVNGAGAGPCSPIASVALPAVPNLTASAGTLLDSVSLTWSGVARSFVLRRRILSQETPSLDIAALPSSAATFSDTTASADGTHYSYELFGCNVSGCTASARKTGYRDAIPGQITNFLASDDSSSSVSFSWTVPTRGRTESIKIYRSLTGNESDFTLFGTTNVPGPAIVDNSVDARMGYPLRYRASAVSSRGEGIPSQSDLGSISVTVPGTPTNVSAVEAATYSAVRLGLSSSIVPMFYDVYRSTDSNGAGCTGDPVYRGRLTAAAANVELAVPQYSVRYFFSVRGLNGAGAGPCSNRVSVPLPNPRSVVASAGTFSEKVALSWNAGSGAKSFVVRRRIFGQENPFVDVAALPESHLTFDDIAANVDGTRYVYEVHACNISGCNPSARVLGFRRAPPSEPRLVAASTDVLEAIDVLWQPPARGNVAGYRLEASSSAGGAFSTVVALPANSLTFRYTAGNNMQYGDTVYFRVVSLGENGTSATSSVASGRARLNISQPIRDLVVTETPSSQLLISWLRGAAGSAGRYTVFRSTANEGCVGEPIATGLTSAAFVDSSFVYGIQHYYSVVSVNSAGTSSCSTIVALPIPNFTLFSTSEGSSQSFVNLAYAANGAKEYRINRSQSEAPIGFTEISRRSTTTYSDNTAPADGSVRWYLVNACNASGCADSSVRPGYRAAAPAAPTNVVASDGTSPAFVEISWNQSPRGIVSEYRVQRSASATGTFLTIGVRTPLESRRFEDNEIAPGVVAFYRVVAVGPLSPDGVSEIDAGSRSANGGSSSSSSSNSSSSSTSTSSSSSSSSSSTSTSSSSSSNSSSAGSSTSSSSISSTSSSSSSASSVASSSSSSDSSSFSSVQSSSNSSSQSVESSSSSSDQLSQIFTERTKVEASLKFKRSKKPNTTSFSAHLQIDLRNIRTQSSSELSAQGCNLSVLIASRPKGARFALIGTSLLTTSRYVRTLKIKQPPLVKTSLKYGIMIVARCGGQSVSSSRIKLVVPPSLSRRITNRSLSRMVRQMLRNSK